MRNKEEILRRIETLQNQKKTYHDKISTLGFGRLAMEEREDFNIMVTVCQIKIEELQWVLEI